MDVYVAETGGIKLTIRKLKISSQPADDGKGCESSKGHGGDKQGGVTAPKAEVKDDKWYNDDEDTYESTDDAARGGMDQDGGSYSSVGRGEGPQNMGSGSELSPPSLILPSPKDSGVDVSSPCHRGDEDNLTNHACSSGNETPPSLELRGSYCSSTINKNNYCNPTVSKTKSDGSQPASTSNENLRKNSSTNDDIKRNKSALLSSMSENCSNKKDDNLERSSLLKDRQHEKFRTISEPVKKSPAKVNGLYGNAKSRTNTVDIKSSAESVTLNRAVRKESSDLLKSTLSYDSHSASQAHKSNKNIIKAEECSQNSSGQKTKNKSVNKETGATGRVEGGSVNGIISSRRESSLRSDDAPSGSPVSNDDVYSFSAEPAAKISARGRTAISYDMDEDTMDSMDSCVSNQSVTAHRLSESNASTLSRTSNSSLKPRNKFFSSDRRVSRFNSTATTVRQSTPTNDSENISGKPSETSGKLSATTGKLWATAAKPPANQTTVKPLLGSDEPSKRSSSVNSESMSKSSKAGVTDNVEQSVLGLGVGEIVDNGAAKKYSLMASDTKLVIKISGLGQKKPEEEEDIAHKHSGSTKRESKIEKESRRQKKKLKALAKNSTMPASSEMQPSVDKVENEAILERQEGSQPEAKQDSNVSSHVENTLDCSRPVTEITLRPSQDGKRDLLFTKEASRSLDKDRVPSLDATPVSAAPSETQALSENNEVEPIPCARFDSKRNSFVLKIPTKILSKELNKKESSSRSESSCDISKNLKADELLVEHSRSNRTSTETICSRRERRKLQDGNSVAESRRSKRNVKESGSTAESRDTSSESTRSSSRSSLSRTCIRAVDRDNTNVECSDKTINNPIDELPRPKTVVESTMDSCNISKDSSLNSVHKDNGVSSVDISNRDKLCNNDILDGSNTFIRTISGRTTDGRVGMLSNKVSVKQELLEGTAVACSQGATAPITSESASTSSVIIKQEPVTGSNTCLSKSSAVFEVSPAESSLQAQQSNSQVISEVVQQPNRRGRYLRNSPNITTGSAVAKPEVSSVYIKQEPVCDFDSNENIVNNLLASAPETVTAEEKSSAVTDNSVKMNKMEEVTAADGSPLNLVHVSKTAMNTVVPQKTSVTKSRKGAYDIASLLDMNDTDTRECGTAQPEVAAISVADTNVMNSNTSENHQPTIIDGFTFTESSSLVPFNASSADKSSVKPDAQTADHSGLNSFVFCDKVEKNTGTTASLKSKVTKNSNHAVKQSAAIGKVNSSKTGENESSKNGKVEPLKLSLSLKRSGSSWFVPQASPEAASSTGSASSTGPVGSSQKTKKAAEVNKLPTEKNSAKMSKTKGAAGRESAVPKKVGGVVKGRKRVDGDGGASWSIMKLASGGLPPSRFGNSAAQRKRTNSSVSNASDKVAAKQECTTEKIPVIEKGSTIERLPVVEKVSPKQEDAETISTKTAPTKEKAIEINEIDASVKVDRQTVYTFSDDDNNSSDGTICNDSDGDIDISSLLNCLDKSDKSNNLSMSQTDASSQKTLENVTDESLIVSAGGRHEPVDVVKETESEREVVAEKIVPNIEVKPVKNVVEKLTIKIGNKTMFTSSLVSDKTFTIAKNDKSSSEDTKSTETSAIKNETRLNVTPTESTTMQEETRLRETNENAKTTTLHSNGKDNSTKGNVSLQENLTKESGPSMLKTKLGRGNIKNVCLNPVADKPAGYIDPLLSSGFSQLWKDAQPCNERVASLFSFHEDVIATKALEFRRASNARESGVERKSEQTASNAAVPQEIGTSSEKKSTVMSVSVEDISTHDDDMKKKDDVVDDMITSVDVKREEDVGLSLSESNDTSAEGKAEGKGHADDKFEKTQNSCATESDDNVTGSSTPICSRRRKVRERFMSKSNNKNDSDTMNVSNTEDILSGESMVKDCSTSSDSISNVEVCKKGFNFPTEVTPSDSIGIDSRLKPAMSDALITTYAETITPCTADAELNVDVSVSKEQTAVKLSPALPGGFSLSPVLKKNGYVKRVSRRTDVDEAEQLLDSASDAAAAGNKSMQDDKDCGLEEMKQGKKENSKSVSNCSMTSDEISSVTDLVESECAAIGGSVSVTKRGRGGKRKGTGRGRGKKASVVSDELIDSKNDQIDNLSQSAISNVIDSVWNHESVDSMQIKQSSTAGEYPSTSSQIEALSGNMPQDIKDDLSEIESSVETLIPAIREDNLPLYEQTKETDKESSVRDAGLHESITSDKDDSLPMSESDMNSEKPDNSDVREFISPRDLRAVKRLSDLEKPGKAKRGRKARTATGLMDETMQQSGEVSVRRSGRAKKNIRDETVETSTLEKIESSVCQDVSDHLATEGNLLAESSLKDVLCKDTLPDSETVVAERDAQGMDRMTTDALEHCSRVKGERVKTEQKDDAVIGGEIVTDESSLGSKPETDEISNAELLKTSKSSSVRRSGRKSAKSAEKIEISSESAEVIADKAAVTKNLFANEESKPNKAGYMGAFAKFIENTATDIPPVEVINNKKRKNVVQRIENHVDTGIEGEQSRVGVSSENASIDSIKLLRHEPTKKPTAINTTQDGRLFNKTAVTDLQSADISVPSPRLSETNAAGVGVSRKSSRIFRRSTLVRQMGSPSTMPNTRSKPDTVIPVVSESTPTAEPSVLDEEKGSGDLCVGDFQDDASLGDFGLGDLGDFSDLIMNSLDDADSSLDESALRELDPREEIPVDPRHLEADLESNTSDHILNGCNLDNLSILGDDSVDSFTGTLDHTELDSMDASDLLRGDFINEGSLAEHIMNLGPDMGFMSSQVGGGAMGLGDLSKISSNLFPDVQKSSTTVSPFQVDGLTQSRFSNGLNMTTDMLYPGGRLSMSVPPGLVDRQVTGVDLLMSSIRESAEEKLQAERSVSTKSSKSGVSKSKRRPANRPGRLRNKIRASKQAVLAAQQELFVSHQRELAALEDQILDLIKVIVPNVDSLLSASRTRTSLAHSHVEAMLDVVMKIIEPVEEETDSKCKKTSALLEDCQVHLCRRPVKCMERLQRKFFKVLSLLLPDLTADVSPGCDAERLLTGLLPCLISVNTDLTHEDKREANNKLNKSTSKITLHNKSGPRGKSSEIKSIYRKDLSHVADLSDSSSIASLALKSSSSALGRRPGRPARGRGRGRRTAIPSRLEQNSDNSSTERVGSVRRGPGRLPVNRVEVDSEASASTERSIPKRRPGRPFKIDQTSDMSSSERPSASTERNVTKRRPGRPFKVDQASDMSSSELSKRGRGRLVMKKGEPDSDHSSLRQSSVPTKRGRGVRGVTKPDKESDRSSTERAVKRRPGRPVVKKQEKEDKESDLSSVERSSVIKSDKTVESKVDSDHSSVKDKNETKEVDVATSKYVKDKLELTVNKSVKDKQESIKSSTTAVARARPVRQRKPVRLEEDDSDVSSVESITSNKRAGVAHSDSESDTDHSLSPERKTPPARRGRARRGGRGGTVATRRSTRIHHGHHKGHGSHHERHRSNRDGHRSNHDRHGSHHHEKHLVPGGHLSRRLAARESLLASSDDEGGYYRRHGSASSRDGSRCSTCSSGSCGSSCSCSDSSSGSSVAASPRRARGAAAGKAKQPRVRTLSMSSSSSSSSEDESRNDALTACVRKTAGGLTDTGKRASETGEDYPKR